MARQHKNFCQLVKWSFRTSGYFRLHVSKSWAHDDTKLNIDSAGAGVLFRDESRFTAGAFGPNVSSKQVGEENKEGRLETGVPESIGYRFWAWLYFYPAARP